jgi:hypothetical protein
MVIAGPLAAAIGTSTVLSASGITILLLTVVCLPEVRNLRRREPSPALGRQ